MTTLVMVIFGGLPWTRHRGRRPACVAPWAPRDTSHCHICRVTASWQSLCAPSSSGNEAADTLATIRSCWVCGSHSLLVCALRELRHPPHRDWTGALLRKGPSTHCPAPPSATHQNGRDHQRLVGQRVRQVDVQGGGIHGQGPVRVPYPDLGQRRGHQHEPGLKTPRPARPAPTVSGLWMFPQACSPRGGPAGTSPGCAGCSWSSALCC